MARSRGVYNRIFTEEKWQQVNKENKAILEDFLTEYKQQKKSQGDYRGLLSGSPYCSNKNYGGLRK